MLPCCFLSLCLPAGCVQGGCASQPHLRAGWRPLPGLHQQLRRITRLHDGWAMRDCVTSLDSMCAWNPHTARVHCSSQACVKLHLRSHCLKHLYFLLLTAYPTAAFAAAMTCMLTGALSPVCAGLGMLCWCLLTRPLLLLLLLLLLLSSLLPPVTCSIRCRLLPQHQQHGLRQRLHPGPHPMRHR
jgi:hypothetical protein